MERKKFISTILIAGAALPVLASTSDAAKPRSVTEPPFLKPGDKIGITSPAGYIEQADILPSVTRIRQWGFEAVTGNTIGKRDFTFGGTDEERRKDMQAMLDDESIKAILCARGGYGLVRILDTLDFSKFVTHPKWLIGFSDITLLHSHVHSNYHIATIHSKMSNSFPADWLLADDLQKQTIESLRHCLTGAPMKYQSPPHPGNRYGQASGQLIGGNLRTLETLIGTKSDVDTANKLLFVEDTGEYLYGIDRMFWHFHRAGKLKKLKGLIVGGFKIKKDDEGEEFSKNLQEIVLEKIKDCRFPVVFDFPVGHQKNNFAVKCGGVHHLVVDSNGSTLSG